MSVDPVNNAELYEMTDKYLIPSGANRLYMFSTVWRGEYHLDHQTMVDVNPKIFPNGKSDLIAYSEYLAKHGAHLQLKSLGPQIGRNDERYISPTHVDHRLMSWCTGTLAEDVDPSATTIRFRLGPEPMLRMRTEGPMRLGNEIISAGRIRRSDNVWVLENCERGYGASTAKSHRVGTEMQGIVLSNNVIDFEDDFGMPNSIAEEICGEYGDFLNEVNVGHLHFDGSGRMGIYLWYVRDFTDYIYTPHRVMGRTSGKDPLIRIDQEWGAVPRFQNIKAPATLELFNPYEKQEPQVVIRVEQGSVALRNPLIKVNGKGELAVKGEIQANEYMKFEGGNTVKVYDNNWNLLRSLPAMTRSFTANKGNNTVTTAAGRGSDTPDLRVQFITLGPVYVLESNRHLQ